MVEDLDRASGLFVIAVETDAHDTVADPSFPVVEVDDLELVPNPHTLEYDACLSCGVEGRPDMSDVGTPLGGGM